MIAEEKVIRPVRCQYWEISTLIGAASVKPVEILVK
jgi:hypothetical protein